MMKLATDATLADASGRGKLETSCLCPLSPVGAATGFSAMANAGPPAKRDRRSQCRPAHASGCGSCSASYVRNSCNLGLANRRLAEPK